MWREIERRGWSHLDFAKAVGITNGGAARLLYGDRGPSLRLAATIEDVVPSVEMRLWLRPCPKKWQPPHARD